MQNREEILDRLERMALRMRKRVLDMALGAGSSAAHLGGGLSMIEIVATLYGAVMKFDPRQPQWPDRDRFILSKGHGVLGYYAALAEAGLLPETDLPTFEKNESDLLGHPVMNRAKGIEFSNGSLGMGLSLGIGVSLAGRRQGRHFRVYVLMGDGECNEGSVWEAAMAAAQFKLSHLVAIVDRNNLQQTGPNRAIMSLEDVASKWASFGWQVAQTDGHDVAKLYEEFTKEREPEKPLALIAHTIKGKGFSFCENNNDWHHGVLTQAQYDAAMSELVKAEGCSR